MNKFLLGLCTIAVATACTDNEVLSPEESVKAGNSAVTLTLADAETRGLWTLDAAAYKFNWQLNDKIGLSMVSRLKDPASVTAGDYTLTNYEYTAKAKIGYTYPGSKGYFETANATVFGGSYVAYYPYNEEYCEPSQTIPVSSPYIQYMAIGDPAVVPSTTEPISQFAGDNTFSYSEPFKIDGGRNASGEIALRNLSGVFQLNLKKDLTDKFATTGLSYIIATTGDFTLGAKKANAGEFPVKGDLVSVVVEPSDNAADYTEKQEALILHMSTANKPNYDANGELTIDGSADMMAYMVALPRPNFFSEGYNFYLVDANHKAYYIEKKATAFAAANITTIKGTFQPIAIATADVKEVKVANKPVYVVADGASLQALSDVAEGSQIYIFNNIELTQNLTFQNGVELIAAKNQGKITVPAGKVLTFQKTSIINTEVEVKKNTTSGLVINESLTIGEKGVVTNSTPFEVPANQMVTVEGKYTNNATLTVKDPAATTSDPNRGLQVVEGGIFTNNKIVDNYGSVSNVKGTFENNEGAEFLDEIGSKLSGTGITQNGDYICVVDKQARLLESVNQRPSTIIRLKRNIDGDNETSVFDAPYEFDHNDWSRFAFEVIENGVIMVDTKAGTGTAKIKSLTVKSGSANIENGLELDIVNDCNVASGSLTIADMVSVGGNVTVTGSFEISEADVNLSERLKVAGNFTINRAGKATFQNNIIARIIGAKGVVNSGTFIIEDATANGNVPAIVYAKDFSTTTGGTYANYPTVVENPAAEKPFE